MTKELFGTKLLPARLLEQPHILKSVEDNLAKSYPQIDFSQDPADELLSGTWKGRIETAIKKLCGNTD